MLTNKIFEVFLCRDLGPNTSPASVLHADYTVDCDETATLRYLGGGALVLLWPVGMPAGLFYAMHARRAKIVAGDEATLRTFAFVLGALVLGGECLDSTLPQTWAPPFKRVLQPPRSWN